MEQHSKQIKNLFDQQVDDSKKISCIIKFKSITSDSTKSNEQKQDVSKTTDEGEK